MLEKRTNKTIEWCVRTSFTGQMKRVSSLVEEERPSDICGGLGNASPQQYLGHMKIKNEEEYST